MSTLELGLGLHEIMSQSTRGFSCPRGNGVMDSVLACGAGEASEPGSIPALSKWFSLGYKVVG